MMNGWYHLARFVDKIRLHLAGKLHPEYQENFTKGFDGAWLKAAGVTAEQMIEVVRNSVCDGQVCDWVRVNVTKSAEDKETFNQYASNFGRNDEQSRARLQWRKEQAGMTQRDDVQCFFDFIDADEKRI